MHFKSLVMILSSSLALTLATVRLTNIRCEELRPKFATFSKCELKMVERGVAALNIYVKLYQLPVYNISVTSSLLKKANGFRPFLYNTTLNFCDFMKNRKKYPFFNIILDMFGKNSNVNHTCPYDHDIILNNVVLKDSMFKYLPLPDGEYMIQLRVNAHNEQKAIVKAYFRKTE